MDSARGFDLTVDLKMQELQQTEPVYTSPVPQVFDNLEALPGVVVKEVTQILDAVMASVGGAYEAQNKYYVRALPLDVKIATTHDEPGAWRPNTADLDALPPVYYVEESSSFCLRAVLAACGGLNLRALDLYFYQGKDEKYMVQRPCRLGGCCGCPLEMRMYQRAPQEQMIGAVRFTKFSSI